MKLILFTLSLFLFSCSTAQVYSTKSKKAIKLFDQARTLPNETLDQQTGYPNYTGAIKLLEQALEKDPDFWEAHMLAGEFEEILRNYPRAIEHYKEALRIAPNHSPSGSTYFFLSDLQFKNGDYEEANKNAENFLMNRNINPSLKKRAIDIKNNCAFALYSMNHPNQFSPVNIGPGINTAAPEYFPTITVDGRTILFTRRIKDDRVQGQFPEQEDFFVSHLSDNNTWTKALPMPRNVNTVNNEGAPTLAPDGKSLIFVACASMSGKNDYGENRQGKGSCDLFFTKQLGSQWTNPVNLPGNVNSFGWESQPSLSSDGKTLYFIRGVYDQNRRKESDIYVSQLNSNGQWGTPERLPNYINSDQAEESVLIHPDGKTLYFASKGHVGMGGSDLFMCKMQKDGNWSKPINLGYPINTKNDENSLMVSPDGEIAFFASNREGGFGDLDIYYFELPESLRPTKTVYFKGLVYDITTNKPIPGKIQLIELSTGKEFLSYEADKINGDFMVSLPIGESYALNVSYPGYTFYSENFDMIVEENQNAVVKNVPLTPISISNPIVLANVFFDLNKSTLRKESFSELNKLYEFLIESPTLRIEISGHTDSRGDTEKNKVLSENRAKAVYDYLIAKGIEANRLAYKGFGSSIPVHSDEKIEAEKNTTVKEKMHQENRRTEYKIIQ